MRKVKELKLPITEINYNKNAICIENNPQLTENYFSELLQYCEKHIRKFSKHTSVFTQYENFNNEENQKLTSITYVVCSDKLLLFESTELDVNIAFQRKALMYDIYKTFSLDHTNFILDQNEIEITFEVLIETQQIYTINKFLYKFLNIFGLKEYYVLTSETKTIKLSFIITIEKNNCDKNQVFSSFFQTERRLESIFKNNSEDRNIIRSLNIVFKRIKV